MRRSMARDFAALPGVAVVMTLDHRLPDEPGPWTIVRVGPGEGEEESVFLRLAAAADHTLAIAPETGRCLETRAHWIRDAGGRSLGSEPAAIALAADKAALAQVFVVRDIRTPPTRVYSRLVGPPRDFRYPAVLKPNDGAGCLSTFVVDSADNLSTFDRYPHPSGLLQPLMPGVPMSASFLVSASGRGRLLAVGEQRMRLVDRAFQYEGGRITGDVDRCDSHVRRALEVIPGLRGFVGVDFLWDETSGRAIVLEVNPRPTTSVHAIASLLGSGKLAAEWLRTIDDSADLSRLPALIRPTLPFEFSVSDDAEPDEGGPFDVGF